jgi:hypothetical protein
MAKLMTVKMIAGEDLKKGDLITLGDDGKLYACKPVYSSRIADAIYEYFRKFTTYPEKIHISRDVKYQLLNETQNLTSIFGYDSNMNPNSLMGFPFEVHTESDKPFWLEPELEKINANP